MSERDKEEPAMADRVEIPTIALSQVSMIGAAVGRVQQLGVADVSQFTQHTLTPILGPWLALGLMVPYWKAW